VYAVPEKKEKKKNGRIKAKIQVFGMLGIMYID